MIEPRPAPARRESDDAGVAAVEFALVLPLLVALVFTIVFAGSVYLDRMHLQSAARDAARIASVDSAAACSTALAQLSSQSVGSVTCQIASSCSSGSIRVELRATQTKSIPLVGNRTITLDAASSFACPLP
ncbi:MAG: pilus assembly protein [Actinobacteria bacterium]|nr:pilus assembly protein [Actinomycetota bacterium]